MKLSLTRKLDELAAKIFTMSLLLIFNANTTDKIITAVDRNCGPIVLSTFATRLAVTARDDSWQ